MLRPSQDDLPPMRTPLSALVLLSLMACAADPAAEHATLSQADDQMVCTRDYPTGSSIPITKCRTREQIERERKVGQDALLRTQSGGPNTSKTTGGN